MLTNRDKTFFDIAKQTTIENENYFTTDELYRIYNYLLSFCVAQVNNNRPTFFRELFDLYRMVLDRQLIFEKGYLSDGIIRILLRSAFGYRKWIGYINL